MFVTSENINKLIWKNKGWILFSTQILEFYHHVMYIGMK